MLCNSLIFNQLPFLFFLYEKRLVSLRRSPRFSTMICLFLYESLSLLVSNILHLLFLSLPLPFCFVKISPIFNLSISFFLFLNLSFFFFFSRAHSYARVYIIMCLHFSSFSLPFIFMFYNTFANQRLTKKFHIYSKIIPDMFCVYCKKVYFCIRLAREAKPLSLTYWKRGLLAKVLNKKTSKKIWF